MTAALGVLGLALFATPAPIQAWSEIPIQAYVLTDHRQGMPASYAAALAKARAEPSVAGRLADVDRYFNSQPVAPIDRDYAVSPPRFLREGGDCKDYVVAKAAMLSELGMRFASMRIAVVPAPDFSPGITHSILLVDDSGVVWVLDSYYPIESFYYSGGLTGPTVLARSHFATVAPIDGGVSIPSSETE